MKLIYSLFIVVFFASYSCTESKKEFKEGKVVFGIDYPNHKDNFFLYSILPKEMDLNFKDGIMESRIEKANLKNILLVDCNKKNVSAYFKYGEDAFHVVLQPDDVENMVNDQQQYTIQFTKEKDTMIGFNVQKAIATAVKNPSDKIELWYTDEIKVSNSNWYNPFHNVKGFLLAYSIDRYGIRMDFKAKRFEEVSINSKQMVLETSGQRILYADYNSRLGDLFQSFE